MHKPSRWRETSRKLASDMAVFMKCSMDATYLIRALGSGARPRRRADIKDHHRGSDVSGMIRRPGQIQRRRRGWLRWQIQAGKSRPPPTRQRSIHSPVILVQSQHAPQNAGTTGAGRANPVIPAAAAAELRIPRRGNRPGHQSRGGLSVRTIQRRRGLAGHPAQRLTAAGTGRVVRLCAAQAGMSINDNRLGPHGSMLPVLLTSLRLSAGQRWEIKQSAVDLLPQPPCRGIGDIRSAAGSSDAQDRCGVADRKSDPWSVHL